MMIHGTHVLRAPLARSAIARKLLRLIMSAAPSRPVPLRPVPSRPVPLRSAASRPPVLCSESGKYSNDSKVNRACKCADTGHRVTKGLRSQTGCVAGSYSNVTCASVCSSCESGKVSTGAKNVKCNCTHPGYTPNLGKTAQVRM